MNKSVLVVMICMLAACSKAAPTDTVDSLVAHSDRLRKVEKQCADDYAKMGAAECNAASEARRRLFMGSGPQYTPPKKPPKF
ncbi:EexN family lipoprotein [Rhodanobacter terrae]|uniref:EexN family lipoprotein n=1 Tax=Rhodanobacter terrae TaxID=418647 RepID=A0ABW0SXC6_9GAMM